MVLPALGVLLALRDKDYNTTIGCIVSAPDSQLIKVKALAHEYAKDLQENIESFRVNPHETNTAASSKAPLASTVQKRKEGSVDRSKVSSAKPSAAAKPGSAVKAPLPKSSQFRPGPAAPAAPAAPAEHEKGPKQAWAAEAVAAEEEVKEQKDAAKALAPKKRFTKKSASPPPRVAAAVVAETVATPKMLPEVEMITAALNAGKPRKVLAEEVGNVIGAVMKICGNKTLTEFWVKMMAKVVGFIFEHAIFVADEKLQEKGFYVLRGMVKNQGEAVGLHLESSVLENLAKCYIFPKKSWETVTALCDALVAKFGAKRIVEYLIRAIPVKEPPVLQAFIRCLSVVIKAAKGLGEVVPDALIKPLFIVWFFLWQYIGKNIVGYKP